MWLRKNRLLWQKKSIKTSMFDRSSSFIKDKLKRFIQCIRHFHFFFYTSWKCFFSLFDFLELFLQIALSLATFTRFVSVFAKGFGYLLFLNLIIRHQNSSCHTLEKYDEQKQYRNWFFQARQIYRLVCRTCKVLL